MPRSGRSSASWLGTTLVLLLVLWAGAARAQDVQPVPALSGRVVDTTNTLDAPARERIDAQLAALEQAKGSQVVFLLVATTAPEDIASYANRVGNAWKIGRREVGDGVLLVVAKDDRKVRIEVAKTLEGAIPDLAAKQIIDEAITPAFRRGDFAGGLSAAADQIAARIKGEALPEPASDSAATTGQGFDWLDLAIFLFIAVPFLGGLLRRMFGRPLGSMLTGGGVGAVAFVYSSSLVVAGIAALIALLFALVTGAGGLTTGKAGRRAGWAGMGGLGGWGSGGGGGGFGSGGGFSSGGGGDFGGGGASGDW
ncbi:MAG: TPM domain-containing protein [Pseudomonadota bacterium]